MAACRTAWDQGSADGMFLRVDKDVFAQCPSDSIDYAVMEKIAAGALELPDAVVVPLSAGWSDVGAWDALWKVPAEGRRRQRYAGRCCPAGVSKHAGHVVRAPGRLHRGRGCCCDRDAGCDLVSHKNRTQDVKKIVEHLKGTGRCEGELHRKVFRPWGSYDSVDSGGRFLVKRIVIKPDASLSLQMHYHRAEHWVVVRGTAKGDTRRQFLLVTENESTFIPLGTKHRLENPGHVPLEMIEVQSGSYLGEDDIVRFEDVYGR